MILGLVDCVTNKLESRPLVEELLQQTDITLQEFTCPEPIKTPVAVKKAFDSGADVVLVYAETSQEQKEVLDLIHSKILDLEIATGKYAYYCLVFDEEWRAEPQLKAIAEKRIHETLREMIATTHGVKQEEKPDSEYETGGIPEISEAQEFVSPDEDKGKSLF